jgi:hypothetical protein
VARLLLSPTSHTRSVARNRRYPFFVSRSLYFFIARFLPRSQSMVNPNNAVLPDYATPAFAEDRQPFLDAGLLEQQAVELLSQQWIITNNRDKEAWARREEEEIIAAAEEEERADQNRRQQEEEEAQILKEERKKNKAKFAAIPKVPVPSEPIILSSQVAIRKIQQHKFCELWYFTNEGLDVADTSLSYTIDDDTLSFVPSTDGTPTLVPTSSACDRSNVTQDEKMALEPLPSPSPRGKNAPPQTSPKPHHKAET